MGVDAVIFDFGGFLCFNPTNEQFARAAATCGLTVPEFLHAFWSNRNPYDAGEIEPETYWDKVAKTAGRKFDRELVTSLRKQDLEFWSHFDNRVTAWADELRGQGLRTAILSNLPHSLGDHLRACSLLKHFDYVTFSCELGAIKPQAAIYEDAIRGLGIPPGQALFLDDK